MVSEQMLKLECFASKLQTPKLSVGDDLRAIAKLTIVVDYYQHDWNMYLGFANYERLGST